MKNFKIFQLLVLVFIIVSIIQMKRVIPLSKIFEAKGVYLEVLLNKDFLKDNTKNAPEILEKEYLIIRDSNNIETGNQIHIINNLEEIFKFSKIGYSIHTSEEMVDLTGYKGVILLKSDYFNMSLDFYEAVERYLKNGGTLYFFNGGQAFNPFNNLIGIKKIKGEIESRGIVIEEEFYPGFKEIGIVGGYYHDTNILDVTLEDDVKVLITNKDKKPLLFERNVEKGKIIYMNSNFFTKRYFQGVMKQIISYGSEIFVSPILNSKVYHIDDLPLPLPESYSDVIYRNYYINNGEFVRDVWWKEMQGVAFRNKIQYTGFMIIDYGAEGTTKEFLDRYGKDWSIKQAIEQKNIQIENLNELGRVFLNEGWEIGIHGYNHNPLSLSGGINYGDNNYYNYYKPWESIEVMKKANEKFQEVIRYMYGENFNVFSYVPPSNLLTKEGKKALIESFPNLKSIGGLFLGDIREKGLALQKVGVDPDYPQLYNLPRFSAGYLDKDQTLWEVNNGVAAYGYVSHFVHPDDIFSEDRNFNKTWEELIRGFENIVKKVNKDHPELVPRSQISLAAEYFKLENLKINKEFSKDKNRLILRMDNYKGEFFIELRLSKKEILNIKNGEHRLKRRYKNNDIYIIKIMSDIVELELGDRSEE